MLARTGFLILAGYALLMRFQPFNLHIPGYLAVTTLQHATLGIMFLKLRRGDPSYDAGGFQAGAKTIFLFAVAMRALMLFTDPTLSDDVYRFLWDGRVQAAGVNPYLYPPDHPALAGLRDPYHALINHPSVRTIYPPLCEWVFRIGAMFDPTPAGQKVVFALFDLAAVGVLLAVLGLRRRSAAWAALYAWSPVTVVEFAGSGHNDSLMIFFVLAAFLLNERGRNTGTAAAMAAATISKWIPVISLPWLVFRRRVRPLIAYGVISAAAVALFVFGVTRAAAPIVPVTSGARTFARDWIFNAGLYGLAGRIVSDPVALKVILGALLVLFAVWWARRTQDLVRYMHGVTLALLLAAPVVHPWYLSWLLPYAAILGSASSLMWAWAASLTYVVQIRYATERVWELPAWVPIFEYALVYGALAAAALRRLKRPAARPVSPEPLDSPTVTVVIPALNEEKAIGLVISDLPPALVREVIVVDNGSTDGTAAAARAAGARVEMEPERGYGRAVQRGIAAASPAADVIVIIDGDRSDFPEDLAALLEPIRRGDAHMVIGSRTEAALPGSLMPQQRFGNWLTTSLIRFLYGHRYRDMGPFRAIRRDALAMMEMRDGNFGWNVEMQVKALQLGLAVKEIPVRYRPRIGQSKISGTLKGTLSAGTIILWSIYNYAFRAPARQA